MISRSISNLKLFVRCERQLYYRKIKLLPQKPSHYLSVGNLYHGAIAYKYLNGSDPGQIVLGEILRKHKYSPLWTCPTPDDVLLREIAANVARLPAFVPVKEDGGYLIELKLGSSRIDLVSTQTPVAGPDGLMWDWIDERCVVDWKIRHGRSRLRPGEDLDQLALYCLKAGPINGCFVEIPRDPSDPLNVVTKRFSDEELRAWERYFSNQFTAMESRGQDEASYRLANRGDPLCCERFCDYYEACPGGAGRG